MKTIYFLLFILFISNTKAQESEKIAVQKTVEAFFEAFHKQDSTALYTFVGSDSILLQTIFIAKNGTHNLRSEEFSALVESIISIPDSIAFQEKLFDFSIQVDGLMANVWVTYEFWYNNEFSHCGVNSIQLFKDDEEKWKIIYLVDTRRKEGCLK